VEILEVRLVITTKEIVQIAHSLVRQLEKHAPMERAEIVALAGAMVQIDVNREIRRRQDPAGFVEDE
jgi:hypothetical protein